ncbi:MAG: HEAT repeat domain-containing protein [Erysipelotrichaceae bacterium]|nr:HEAT repeat domain-containing protein [Erysipelotrichaceae bacterium]
MRTYEDIHSMVLRNDVKGLILAASDADETIREEAVKVLRALNPPEAKEVLTLALDDPSPNVRSAASGISQEQVVQQAMAEMALESNEETDDEDDDVIKEKELNAIEDRRDSLQWLWTLFTIIGVSSILFVMLILIFMFSGGDFGNTGQMIGILIIGIPGIVLLWISFRKLRERKEKDVD